jgi:hypothetical protein
MSRKYSKCGSDVRELLWDKGAPSMQQPVIYLAILYIWSTVKGNVNANHADPEGQGKDARKQERKRIQQHERARDAEWEAEHIQMNEQDAGLWTPEEGMERGK